MKDTTNSQSGQDTYKEFCLIDAAFGGVDKRNRVIQRQELISAANEHAKRNGSLYKEMYTTYFRYPAEFLEHFNAVIKNDAGDVIKKKKSVALYKGRHYADYFIVDIDDEKDPSKAQFATRGFLQMLESRYTYDLKTLRIFFSGFKGFHVEIPSAAFGFKPSTNLNEIYRYIIGKLGIPFDTSVYDNIRLWRLPNTINAKSGFYKIQLSADELLTLPISKIQELAKKPRKGIIFDSNVGLNPELHKLYLEAKENVGKQESQPGDKRRAYKDFFDAGASSGNRHESIISVAGMLKAKGVPLEDAIVLCLSLNQSHNKPPKDPALIIKDVEDVYKRYQNNARADDKSEVNKAAVMADKEILTPCEFPFEVFNPTVKGIIERISAALQVEQEVVACIMLSLISGAVGHNISVSPKYGHEVAPFLWLIIVARSGYGKTPAFNALVKPVKELQAERYNAFKKELADWKKTARAAKADPTVDLPEEPQLEQYFVSDVTVEALSKGFESNPRGVVSYQDELSGLIFGLNQYKASGRGNDRQRYLELWDCQSWKIDRKSGSLFIPNTGAAITGGIQPNIMPRVFSEDSFDDGMLPRFLFVMGEHKPLTFSRLGIAAEDLSYWNSLLKWCYNSKPELDDNGFVRPKRITLGAESLKLWESFYNEYGQLMPFLSDRAQLFIPKLLQYGLKLMGVLYIFEVFNSHGGIKEIKEIKDSLKKEIVEKAIQLTRFFTGQAMNILDLYKPDTEKLTEWEQRLIKTLYTLRDSVTKARLPLASIVKAYNTNLPEKLKQTPESISSLLRKNFGLTTKQETDNITFLIWEPDKIKNLFSRITLISLISLIDDNAEPAPSAQSTSQEESNKPNSGHSDVCDCEQCVPNGNGNGSFELIGNPIAVGVKTVQKARSRAGALIYGVTEPQSNGVARTRWIYPSDKDYKKIEGEWEGSQ